MDAISQEVPLADRKNMVYSGGFVTYGRGTFVVTEIGMQTEVGKIASLIQNAEARKTPLQKTLDQFGKRLSMAILIICALVFVLSLVRSDAVNFVRHCAGSCGNSGGAQLYCHHCALFRHTEDVP